MTLGLWGWDLVFSNQVRSSRIGIFSLIVLSSPFISQNMQAREHVTLGLWGWDLVFSNQVRSSCIGIFSLIALSSPFVSQNMQARERGIMRHISKSVDTCQIPTAFVSPAWNSLQGQFDVFNYNLICSWSNSPTSAPLEVLSFSAEEIPLFQLRDQRFVWHLLWLHFSLIFKI